MFVAIFYSQNLMLSAVIIFFKTMWFRLEHYVVSTLH